MKEETIDIIEALFKLVDKRVGVFQTTTPGKSILNEQMDKIRELELEEEATIEVIEEETDKLDRKEEQIKAEMSEVKENGTKN